jgi:hypothetical protein
MRRSDGGRWLLALGVDQAEAPVRPLEEQGEALGLHRPEEQERLRGGAEPNDGVVEIHRLHRVARAAHAGDAGHPNRRGGRGRRRRRDAVGDAHHRLAGAHFTPVAVAALPRLPLPLHFVRLLGHLVAGRGDRVAPRPAIPDGRERVLAAGAHDEFRLVQVPFLREHHLGGDERVVEHPLEALEAPGHELAQGRRHVDVTAGQGQSHVCVL